ncbi:SMP-30/gluconolactonase/LRE family protein [Variovorax sp. LARHSF232]
MRKVLGTLAALLTAGIAYLLLWPVPIDPVPWTAPPAPGYAGLHAQNQRLAKLNMLDLGSDVGPEHIVWRDGWLYAAVARGAIIRMRPDGSERQDYVLTGGRPLGFDFDAQGALVIADPMFGRHGGLVRAVGSGSAAKLELLSDAVDGEPIRYADGVVVAPSGKIYFTDASQRFGAKASGGTFEASVLDVLEHRLSGRVLEFDPATRKTRKLMGDLSFANGLALSADGRHLFVSETGEYRVWKLAIDAQNLSARAAATAPSDKARLLLANLPGYPDNIMRGNDGRLWVGLAKPRGAFIDDNAGKPWMRALALRLPKFAWPVPPAYGHVIAFDESGRVLADLQDPSGSYPETTAVTETPDRLYVQSLHAHGLGWLEKGKAMAP